MQTVTATEASGLPAVITYGPTLPDVQTVRPLEPITVSIDALRAALICASKEEARYYLCGVFMHRTADGFIRAVSTDGHRLIVANLYREHADQKGPAWLDIGVIIPADMLAAKLAIIDKAQSHLEKGNRPVEIAFADGASHLEVRDAQGFNVFKVKQIDGAFPDYVQRMGGFGGAFDDSDRGEFQPTAFDPKYLKSVGDIATRLGAKAVLAYGMPDDIAKNGKRSPRPSLFTFGGLGVALVVMPMRTEPVMHEADRIVLSSAIKSSVAALRAHETRNRKAAKKLTGDEKVAALAKAESFKARLEALLARAGNGDVVEALPPPAPEPEQVEEPVEEQQEVALADGLGEGEQPEVEQVAEEQVVERQGARRGRKNRKAKR